jgi:PAS domain S-box-containing protein
MGKKTKRKRLEEERDRLAFIVESSDDAIIGKTADGIITSWNRGAEKIYGYHADEVIGKPITILSPPNRFDEVPRILEKLGRGERVEHFETVRVTKDGRQINISLCISPIIDATGRIMGFSTIARDITKQKQAEEELRRSEALLRITFDETFQLMGLLRPDGTLVKMNQAAADFIRGKEPGEIHKPVSLKMLGLLLPPGEGREAGELGKPFWETPWWTHSPEQQALLREAVEAAARGEFVRFEVTHQTPEGKLEWFDFSIKPVKDERGNIVLLVPEGRNITERKQAEAEIEMLNANLAKRADELEAANQELEAFNYTVSHDLRKPLSNINLYCQLIEEQCGIKLDEECRGYVRGIYDGTWKMSRLMDTLLEFSRLSHAELHEEMVDLSGIAKEVAVGLRLNEPERRVSFKITDSMIVNADPSLLRIVLENLLGNAWKYTGKKDEAVIEFGTTGIGGRPVFFVRDNGTGFDMADAEKLFVPFRRLNGTDEFMGHGIGLATVERIIKRHGGRVWAEGEPGKGATFYFTLSAD